MEQVKFMGKIKKKTIVKLVGIFILTGIVFLSINSYVIGTTREFIKQGGSVDSGHVDCIIVLGAAIGEDNTLSPMLKDRVDMAIDIYKKGASARILMSGDNSRIDHNEVYAMKKYAIAQGVPADVIFIEHAGFSTYETMVRAKKIFKIKTAIIVTQKYHLYRSVYIARNLGIDAYGEYTLIEYNGQIARDAREVLARVKDFVNVIFEPDPKYLGDQIPINGTPPVWEE